VKAARDCERIALVMVAVMVTASPEAKPRGSILIGALIRATD
jgi:hypothetical protein